MRRPAVMLALGLGACAVTPSAGSQHYVVFFQEWSAGLDDNAAATIGAASRWADAHPREPVIVIGYAAPEGSRQASIDLSRSRVGVVADQLTRHGVEPARIRLTAHGPIDATTASTESRRVEIDIAGT
ncbi:MAG: OmpA family protein [Acetobacteraceae bacterium]|nr:OmpA family protein [Acetobacteraceae bacterium]